MKQKECGIGVWDRKKNEVTLCDRKMRVQYETKGNCTFNSSLALALRYRLDRKVAGTLSDGKIGVLMYVCSSVLYLLCSCSVIHGLSAVMRKNDRVNSYVIICNNIPCSPHLYVRGR